MLGINKTKLILAASALLLTACTKQMAGLPGLSDVASSNSSLFAKSFQSNLIAAGMSAGDAAFVASSAAQESSGSNKAFSKAGKAGSDDWKEVAEASQNGAVKSVSNNGHFPTVEDKKNALELIAEAHIKSLDQFVDADDLADMVESAALAAGNNAHESGLSGNDLKDALERQGRGLVKGLESCSVDSSKDRDILSGFANGTARGLAENSHLSGSASQLIAAATSGTLGEIGNDGKGRYDDVKRGQIVTDVLNGVKDGVTASTGLDDTSRANILNDVVSGAQTAAANSSNPVMAVTVSDVLANFRILFPNFFPPLVPPSTVPPVPSAFPVPVPPVENGSVLEGTLVASSDQECWADFPSLGDGPGVPFIPKPPSDMRPAWGTRSLNQCKAFCERIANSNFYLGFICRYNAENVKEYSPDPRIHIEASFGTTCFARVAKPSGTYDYRPSHVVTIAGCRSFCDGVDTDGGTKLCYAYKDYATPVLLFDYSAPVPTPVSAPPLTLADATQTENPTKTCSFENASLPAYNWTLNGLKSLNACLAKCDEQSSGNFNFNKQITCKYNGEVVKTYAANRAPYASAVACLARVTNELGSFDFKPTGLIHAIDCRAFCDTVPLSLGAKVCYNGLNVVFAYPTEPPPPPNPLLTAPTCGVTYDLSNPGPLGIMPPVVCTPNNVTGPGSVSGPVLHTIEMYDTSPETHQYGPTRLYRLESAVTINIAAGTQPIYLGLRANEPIKFILTGATERIVKVFVASYHCAQVEGLDPAKVFITGPYQFSDDVTSLRARLDMVNFYMNPTQMVGANLPTKNFTDALYASTLPDLAGVPLGTSQYVKDAICYNNYFQVP